VLDSPPVPLPPVAVTPPVPEEIDPPVPPVWLPTAPPVLLVAASGGVVLIVAFEHAIGVASARARMMQRFFISVLLQRGQRASMHLHPRTSPPTRDSNQARR
jgi:hypothetical protein